jgi:DNA processing protein
MRQSSDSSQERTADPEDLRHWLALHRAPRIGARRFMKLLTTFGAAADVFRASPDQLRAAGLPDECIGFVRNPDWAAVDRDLEWLASSDNHVIRYIDPAYPPMLGEIAVPPALLFVHGNPDCLGYPQLAIVGSRNPSHAGQSLAGDFAAYLASCGLTITSGLASGIDGAAHRGAIEAKGTTVAVAGTGLDRVYPARHRELAHHIAEAGALASEFPPGTAPLPANFPLRNRIISGLSLGTLIVEAALHSGSLITARSALEQGREVFAIPGSIHNPLARGCHALIREGAKLVETGEHILEELAPQLTAFLPRSRPRTDANGQREHGPEQHELSAEYSQLLDYIGYDPVFVDQLVERSGLTPEEVSSMLLVLELDGHLVGGAGGSYSRVR